jgi:hypothetical protein
MDESNQVTTTDRRVAEVVAIIGHDKARIHEIERVIHSLDWEQQTSEWPPRPHNKPDQLIARSYGRAFARLEKQLDRRNDAGVLNRVVYREGKEFDDWRAQLREWRERFEVFGGKPTFAGSLFNHQDLTRRLGRPKPSAERFRRKRQAAAAAASLLKSHGLPLTATRKSSSTEASVFCRVAAALFGDPRANLYHQCRVLTETRNRVSK